VYTSADVYGVGFAKSGYMPLVDTNVHNFRAIANHREQTRCVWVSSRFTSICYIRKRVSPRFVLQSNNIDTTNDRCWGGSSSGTPKRNERENTKGKKCRQRRINENEDDSQPLRPPEDSTTLLAPRNAAYQATHSRRNATTTTLLPDMAYGFPRYAKGRGREGGYPTPFRKARRRPRASPRRCRTSRQGFLPTSNQPRPQTIHRAPPYLPSTNMRHHGLAATIAVSP